MHIPDSALSPVTAFAANAVMLPIWSLAARRVRTTLALRQVPLLSIGAAFCFTIMLFNIPVPGGTTVHPIGGLLMAVLLGPWAAVLGVTVALVIQALFFADGGVLAIGANCFSMAFAMPVVGYAVYRLIAGNAPRTSGRHAVGAAVGAYVGLNVAALLVATLLGIQPALAHEPDGRALYFPFGLSVTVPAILLPHLLVAGFAEAFVTGLVVRYIQTAGLPLFAADRSAEWAAGAVRPRFERLALGLLVLLALAPLGLLARGEAWGEWGAEELEKRVGYVPKNFETVEKSGWKGFQLLPDYLSEKGAWAYLLAGAVGITLVGGMLYGVGRLLARRQETDKTDENPPSGTPPTQTVPPGEIPAWMRTSTTPDEKTERRAHRAVNIVEKTLGDLSQTAQESLLTEKWARSPGLLQRLDPRGKIVAFIGFLVLVSFLHHAGSLLLLYAFSLWLGRQSRLPLGLLLRRVWLTVPLFTAAVALPAALNLVHPGEPLLVLWRTPFLAVTKPGALSALLLVLRVGVAVAFVTLLTLTTRWNDLLGALRVLWVPAPFVMVLAMTYRYLAVLAQAATDLFLARRSRTVGRASRSVERRFLGGAAGALFGKTYALTQEVHQAMLSRGWTGTPRAVRPLRLARVDRLWLGAMTCAGGLTLLVEWAVR